MPKPCGNFCVSAAEKGNAPPAGLCTLPLLHYRKNVEPVLEQAAHQEILAHAFFRAHANARAQLRLLENLDDPLRGLFG